MPRQGRIDAPGVVHHVMTRGMARGAIFRDKADYSGFLERIGRVFKKSQTSCYAWALMPNHVHLVVATGTVSLGVVLQRTLTGHAVSFNRRWKRSGHLFESRYKSLLCESDPYLLALVRYVHLNPVRAGLVGGLSGLARYQWTGHRALLGLADVPWQDTRTVLSTFGGSAGKSREAYQAFCAEGLSAPVPMGLEGQGLRRLVEGGWESAREGRDGREDKRADERIVGSKAFVERILREAGQRERVRSRIRRSGVTIESVVRQAAESVGLRAEHVAGSGKRPAQVRARALACYWLVEKLGMREVEVARRLGVTQPAVSQAIDRGRQFAAEGKLGLRQG